MAPVFEQTDFDSGLYLLGGREQPPQNALRVADGINAIHSKSIRSRDGTKSLYATAQIIAVYSFAGHRYAVDNTGDIYQDGSIIYVGSTYNGGLVTFTKAPPNFGSTAYLFVNGITPPIKISEAGVVTNWGIAQPPDGMTAALITQPVVVPIDTLDDASSSATAPLTSESGNTWALTTSGSAALTSATFTGPTGNYPFQIIIPPQENCYIQTTASFNLATAGAGDFDAISFMVHIDKPDNLKAIHLAFDVNSSGYSTDAYHFVVPVSDLVASNITATANDIASLDALASSILHTKVSITQVLGVDANALSVEYLTNLRNSLLTYQHNQIGKPFKPSVSAQNLLINRVLQITSGNDSWWTVSIPRRFFTHVSATPTTNEWALITGARFRFVNISSASANVNVYLANLAFAGGVGMDGTYQYLVSYSNASGHYSNPNSASAITPPDPVTITNVVRQGVALSSIPTSGDPQVTGRILWRTVGNGGLYYALPNPSANTSGTIPQLPTIADNTTTTFNDVASDFFGYGPSDTDLNVLTSIPLVPLQVLPTSGPNASTYFNGTLFSCGDTASGSKGRFYYSAPGYAEGVAGFTDISNDDDPTKGFAIFGNQLFLLTTKACWQISDISQGPLVPLFTAYPVVGAPGCKDAASIVTTSNAIVYRSSSGLVGMNGYGAFVVAAQLLPLFLGESVESYAPIGSILAATYTNIGEYIFSDGSTNTYAVNVASRSLVNVSSPNDLVRSVGIPTHALYFEPESNNVQCSFGTGQIGLLEYIGQLTDGAVAVPFNVRPVSVYYSIKSQLRVQRIFIDANLNGNTLTAYYSVDGTDIELGLISGTARKVFEFELGGYGATGRLAGIYLSGSTNVGLIEVFRVAIEGEPYGTATEAPQK